MSVASRVDQALDGGAHAFLGQPAHLEQPRLELLRALPGNAAIACVRPGSIAPSRTVPVT